MVEKIGWTVDALNSYNGIIAWLEKEWTPTEVAAFINKVNKKLSLISINPFTSRRSPKRQRAKVFTTMIDRHTTLYYRYRPRKKQIELLVFWQTRQNPRRLKY
jgi:plasmid stabilization system protein ParE